MKIALLGLGVVGSGVYHQLVHNAQKIELETGSKVELTYGLVKEIKPVLQRKFSKLKLTTNIMDILNDEKVDCIIEVMGSIEVAYEIIKLALMKKKHVVSANKDLIARHGVELMKIAKDNDCDFYFEASVAGGIPIIRAVTKGLASDHLYDIKGILNGTSNYILTKMSNEKISYEKALKQAQELGFAESNPTNDVAGFDAACKVAILAMLCYHVDATFDDVDCIGIENITIRDFEIAHEIGYEIKLIGHSHYENGKLELSVAPTFVNCEHQLANVDYEMNAIYVSGKLIGEVMLFGAGAGSNPTATAVLSDTLEIARNMMYKCNGRDIIIPTNNKNITNELANNKYIFLGDSKSLQNLLTTVSALKITKDYIISELDSINAKRLALKFDCKVFAILDV